jgi:hypothetical protein
VAAEAGQVEQLEETTWSRDPIRVLGPFQGFDRGTADRNRP